MKTYDMEDPKSFVSLKLIQILQRHIRTSKEKFPWLNVVDMGLDYDSEDESTSSNVGKQT